MAFFKGRERGLLNVNNPSKTTNWAEFSEVAFVEGYLRSLFSKINKDICLPIQGENDLLFNEGGGDIEGQVNKLVGNLFSIRDIVFELLLATDNVIVYQLRITSSEFGYFVSDTEEEGVLTVGGKEFEIVKSFKIKPIFANPLIIRVPIKVIYNNYKSLFVTAGAVTGIFLGKKGLNAIFQGASPDAISDLLENAQRQFQSAMNAGSGIVDADDKFFTFRMEVAQLRDAVDFARIELATLLGIPKNQLTGEQYTNTLGSAGAELIDERKYRRVLDEIREKYIFPMLTHFSVDFAYEKYSLVEKFDLALSYGNATRMIIDDEVVSLLKEDLIAVLKDANR